jgi:hypothetical protein
MHGIHPAEGVAVRRTAVRRCVGLAALGLLAPAVPAHADHAMPGGHHDSSGLAAGVSVEAARFDNGIYAGSYEGITPAVVWARGWFSATARMGLYHLIENGLDRYGAGDVAIASHATVVTTETAHAGVALHVTLPTGAEPWFGMRHVMAMPSIWARWSSRRLTVTANTGYCRALAAFEGESHRHGGALVDPMNMQELTWDAGLDVAVGRRVLVGGRARGAVPIGTGVTRAIGAGRVGWGTPRVSTGLEIQLGLAGDPFTVRGVLDTALRF